MPTPVLLRGLEFTGSFTCVTFNRFELGSRTDYPDEVPEILVHTVNIQVDGRRINEWVEASLGWFDHTICFDHNDADVGLHVGAIEFSTTSEENNSYMWAFRVSVNDDGKVVVTYPASLLSYPS